jgi:hypothetical protein
MTVDEFVEANVAPEHRDIVAMLRTLMREAAPEATERMYYGLPMWVGRRPIALISPNKQGITFGFPFGKYLEDRHGLLKGRAKHARNVTIKRLEDANEEALRDYVAQALELDRRHD